MQVLKTYYTKLNSQSNKMTIFQCPDLSLWAHQFKKQN